MRALPRTHRLADDLDMLRTTLRVAAIAAADYPTPAQRTAWSVLDNTGFAQRFGYALPDWQSDLDDVLDTLARRQA